MNQAITKTIPNSFEVTRMIEKEVVVLKKVKEKQTVGFTDLTENEIYSLSLDESRAVGIAYKRLYEEYKEIAADQLELLKFVTPEPSPTTQPSNASIHTDTPSQEEKTLTEHPKSSKDGGSPTLGAKVGKTSEHHYVFYHKQTKKWCNTFTNDAFTSELACASFVNKHLDSIGDFERPRNKIGDSDETRTK